MYRRLLIPILSLLMLVTVAPAAAHAPASPVATGGIDARALDIEADPLSLAISPDGRWLAGTGPGRVACFWDIETLTSQCADEELPIFVHPSYPAIAWAPDSSAVAFSLDAPRMAYDSDIYVFERESGALTNLTDDGYEGRLLDAPDGTPIDIVPTWSPDGQQIVFSRSVMEDSTSATTVMRIDRAGGELVEVVSPDLEEPMTIWAPMHWLPNDTIVYPVVSSRVDEPVNGVWRVGVDGADPELLIPGHAALDIPAALVAGVSPENGAMSLYSSLLLGQPGTTWEQPIFWMGSLDGGAPWPLPYYDPERGAALDPASIQPTDLYADPGPMFPASPATFSPDGSSAVGVYRNRGGESLLATIDLASGQVTLLPALPDGTELRPVAPQWADDGTILLLTESGPMLLTLATGD